jgi:hypothetical protein
VTAILWFETRRYATLLTMRIATIDLILKERPKGASRRIEVVHSAAK